jgi:hypothetical protein
VDDDEPGIVAGAVTGQPLFRIKSRTLLKLGFVYAAQFSFRCRLTLLRLFTQLPPPFLLS